MITLPSPVTERTLYLSKTIDTSSINDIVKELNKIIASDSDISRFCQIERGFSYIPEPIRIYINSSGGSVYLKQTERLNDLINKLLAEHTKISISRLADKDKYKEDWWISAPEALELGIIDEIIG